MSSRETPTFLCIGAQKCGTTWLAHVVSQHPRVCSAIRKEVHFFNKPEAYARGMQWYGKQFDHCAPGMEVGEYTPNYLWLTEEGEPEDQGRNGNVCELVARHIPDAKLIVMVRDPVQRAISAYMHHIRKGRVRPWQSLTQVAGKYGIVSMGLYHRHLTRWLEYFERDRFLFLVFEDDVVRSPLETVQSAFQFIGVDRGFTPSGLSMPRNRRPADVSLILNHFSPRLASRLAHVLPAVRRVRVPGLRVTDSERESLRVTFQEDSHKLQELLGRNLPWSTTRERV